MNQKTNKGITLIALVINIIVLLILAGVTINMVLGDEGIIHQAEDAGKLQEKESELERVKFAVASALIDGKGKVNSLEEALNNEFKNDLENKPTYKDGKITLSNGDIYTVTSSGEVTKFDAPSSSAAQWTLPTDDTEVNVGDLLTPTVEGLENEQFYVIAEDETTLTLLAKTCINTDTDQQDYEDYSMPAFGDYGDEYAGSAIQELVNDYVETLEDLDLEDVEVECDGSALEGIKGRLLWKKELRSSEFTKVENYNDIVFGPEAKLSYWLGGEIQSGMYITVIYRGEITVDEVIYEDYYGVRPVIKILKTSVE